MIVYHVMDAGYSLSQAPVLCFKQTAFYFSCTGQVLARQGADSHGGKEVPTVLAGDEWRPYPMMGRAILEIQ